jgi:hypothetical protein
MDKETILVHLPSYRDPEMVPTVKDALKNAKYPERVHFGICRQYKKEDGFDSLEEFVNDERFNIYEVDYTQAKGLAWARAQINDKLLTDQDYVLQLDSHHRFAQDWDETLIEMYKGLEEKGHRPVIGGYLPLYTPFNDPAGRTMDVWQSQFRCFYPFHTIFIGPGLLEGWQDMTEPVRARFLSGHFCFARAEWAREVRHDPNIYFAGEEINLSVRSYTHGWDLFGLHKLVIWHSTMREERSGICKWDDDAKRGVDWTTKENEGRRRIRVLFGVEEDPNIDFGVYGLGDKRTVHDYEKYAGVCFKDKSVQKYTAENKLPPNPFPLGAEEIADGNGRIISFNSEKLWKESLHKSFYWVVHIEEKDFPKSEYSQILIAFDDHNGKGINSRYASVEEFDSHGHIHYAEMFLVDEWPMRLVYWGIKKDGSWGNNIVIDLKTASL